jgi:hypothetical protein
MEATGFDQNDAKRTLLFRRELVNLRLSGMKFPQAIEELINRMQNNSGGKRRSDFVISKVPVEDLHSSKKVKPSNVENKEEEEGEGEAEGESQPDDDDEETGWSPTEQENPEYFLDYDCDAPDDADSEQNEEFVDEDEQDDSPPTLNQSQDSSTSGSLLKRSLDKGEGDSSTKKVCFKPSEAT